MISCTAFEQKYIHKPSVCGDALSPQVWFRSRQSMLVLGWPMDYGQPLPCRTDWPRIDNPSARYVSWCFMGDANLSHFRGMGIRIINQGWRILFIGDHFMVYYELLILVSHLRAIGRHQSVTVAMFSSSGSHPFWVHFAEQAFAWSSKAITASFCPSQTGRMCQVQWKALVVLVRDLLALVSRHKFAFFGSWTVSLLRSHTGNPWLSRGHLTSSQTSEMQDARSLVLFRHDKRPLAHLHVFN